MLMSSPLDQPMRDQVHAKFVGLCVSLLLFRFTLLCVDRQDAARLIRRSHRSSRSSSRKATSSNRGQLQGIEDSTTPKRIHPPPLSKNITVGLVDYCVGESYEALRKLVAVNRQTYANKWNYTIFSGNQDVFPLQSFVQPLAWLKAAYFYQLLTSTEAEGVDWFLWMDCDALITRFDLSIDDILRDLNAQPSHDIVVAKDPHTEFNSGVMFVRNNEWSRDLWKRALQEASNVTIREHRLWEQQALLELYRENKHEEKSRVLVTPHRWKINAFRTPRRNDFNQSTFAWHRVNCRDQPVCNDLFEAFFCQVMPRKTYSVDLLDCTLVNTTLLDAF